FDEVPLRFVVEHDDVEPVAEPCRDRLHDGIALHPRAARLDAVGKVEGDRVPARDQAVRELDHAPDPAEALEMRLDEAETQTPPRIRHEERLCGAVGTIATVRTPREAFRARSECGRHRIGGTGWAAERQPTPALARR